MSKYWWHQLQTRAWWEGRVARGPYGRRLTITLAIVVALLITFAGILHGLGEQESVAWFDNTLRGFMLSHRTTPLTNVFEFFTGLASINGTFVLLALVILLAWEAPHRRAALVLTVGTLSAVLVTVALKLSVARERPDVALRLVHETSFSFPSGHTMNAVITFGLIGYMLARCSRRGWRHWVIGLTAIAVIALVGLSRIYLGVHYPSDVLASLCLGGAGLILLVGWTNLRERIFTRTMFDRGLAWRLCTAVGITALIVLLFPDIFV